MAEMKLKLKKQLEFPLEADSITPDKFAGKSNDEIKKLAVYYGNEESTIGKLADVVIEVPGRNTEESENIMSLGKNLS